MQSFEGPVGASIKASLYAVIVTGGKQIITGSLGSCCKTEGQAVECADKRRKGYRGSGSLSRASRCSLQGSLVTRKMCILMHMLCGARSGGGKYKAGGKMKTGGVDQDSVWTTVVWTRVV